jgi:glycosyltransferase involved in cell wall biosynthesis
MNILKVIHGYPMRFNAGSEVYSQTLCFGLAGHGHSIDVFTREEDSFAPDFNLQTEQDPDNKNITVYLVNNPRMKDRYKVEGIDKKFAEVLERVKPDIVHFGHLNHLSTGLVEVAKSKNIPIVFTLHDYWLMCPRGQFMQFFPEDKDDIWACCESQEDKKCAELCYARYFSGENEFLKLDFEYWTSWVKHRMEHTKKLTQMVDVFIAPAKYLYNRFHKEFGVPENKLIYLDYGFDLSRFGKRNRKNENSFVFGYIGTHIPSKGIHILIRAFGRLNGSVRLRIWGKPRGQDTESLEKMSSVYGDNIEWKEE